MSSLKPRKEKNCLNCGHIVEERYCTHCGQENIELKEDAWHMIVHALADYFHFEHKFFGTLKPLLFKPGKLTTEYVAGKRASFLHPIKLYIFISIVFFIFAFSNGNKNTKELADTNKTAHISNGLNTTKKDSVFAEQLTAVEENLKYIPNTNGLRDSVIKEAKAEILKENLSDDDSTDTKSWKNSKWNNEYKSIEDYEKQQLKLSERDRDGLIEAYFTKKYIKLGKEDDPNKKIIEGITHNLPKMMFILLPLFALFLKLVYLRKNRFYYEHLIYSFHTHSAMFIAILITIFFSKIFSYIYDISDILSSLCFFYIIWYIYRSLRTFYGSARWMTIFKMILLNFCYTIALTLCFLGLIAVGFIIG